jgi:hypothetical protein
MVRLLAFGYWSGLTLATMVVLRQKLAVGELTQELRLPTAPFMVIWVVLLALSCVLYLVRVFTELRSGPRREASV